MDKTTKNNRGTAPKQESATVSRKDSHLVGILSQMQKFVVPVFFVALWAVLAFYESALLQRTESFSLFLFDATYFDNMMSLPAGLLSYIYWLFPHTVLSLSCCRCCNICAVASCGILSCAQGVRHSFTICFTGTSSGCRDCRIQHAVGILDVLS